MSTMSIRLPESLHERARKLAKTEGVSVNQLIATALAEKISALDTVSYLKERAARGSEAAFREGLSRVPSGSPVPGDELPEELRRSRKGRARGK
jgi:predicted transcriptional regulator